MKYNYYIGLRQEDGIVFVTKLNNATRQFYIERAEKPLALPLGLAKAVSEAMCMNYYQAVVVQSIEPIQTHWLAVSESEVLKGTKKT